MEDSQLTPDGQHDVHSFLMQQIAKGERAASRERKAQDKRKRDGEYTIKGGRVSRKSH